MPRHSSRRRSPYSVIDFERYRYDGNEHYKDPITRSRRSGNITRVTVSSPQIAFQTTGVDPVGRSRTEMRAGKRRRDHESRDDRRSRSRSVSRDSRRPRRDHGSIADEQVPTLSFDFDDGSIASTGVVQSSSVTLEDTEKSQLRSGNVPVAGATTDLLLAGSRWLGNTFDSWDVSAEFTLVAPHLRPVISWYHLERHMPTFDEFIAVARRELQRVPERNLRRVEEMLRKIQRENEKQRQHGREMVPICMSDVEYRIEGKDNAQDFSACFSAFPFFSLENLAEGRSRSSTPNAPVHPARPLLQTYTRTMNDKRELSQAITKNPSTPKGHTLHVSSVWCLLVNEDTIITCSNLGLDRLRKDFTSTPNPKQPTNSARTVHIRSGNSRSWSLPADRLKSWPSLLATFADDFSAIGDRHARATFTHQGRVIDRKSWNRLLASASNSPIVLVLRDGSDDDESGIRSKLQTVKEAFRPRAALHTQEPDVTISANGATAENLAKNDNAVHRQDVISHLRSFPALSIFQRDSKTLSRPVTELADLLHRALVSQSQKGVLQGYDSCREATVEDVQAAISQDSLKAGKDGGHRAVDDKFTGIALLAEYLFIFFWPIDCDHIMTRRFWGAIHTFLNKRNSSDVENNDRRRGAETTRRNAEGPHRRSEMAAQFYDVLYRRVFAVASTLTSTLAGSEISSVGSFPSKFYEAWLHILSAFVLLSEQSLKDTGRHAWRLQLEQLKVAASKLEAGERELVLRLREVEIEEYEVCSTRGIVSLLFNSLSRDAIREAPDVAQTYSDYFQQLDAKVLGDPLTRAHQATIRDLQQELEAVLNTLNQQLDVVNVFVHSLQAQDEEQKVPYLSPLFDSRQDAVLDSCKSTLLARIDQFQALQVRATELGEWHLGEIDDNKDKQEAAIMVFTIVTIIFLPLSFVASVLGMNTSDIRDMQYGQWVYWTAAIPLTIVVIAGSLYWAGALGDWHAWSGRSRSDGDYQLLEEEPAVRLAGRRRDPVEYRYQERPRRRTTFPSRDPGREYV